jgi:hypothetical protein
LNIISNPPGSVNRCRVRCGAPTPSTLLQFGSLPLRISTTPCSCPRPAVTCGGPPRPPRSSVAGGAPLPTACRSSNRIRGDASWNRRSSSPATVRRRSAPRSMAAPELAPRASHHGIPVRGQRDEQFRVNQTVSWTASASSGLRICQPRVTRRMRAH